jgi:hypothetical protein
MLSRFSKTLFDRRTHSSNAASSPGGGQRGRSTEVEATCFASGGTLDNALPFIKDCCKELLLEATGAASFGDFDGIERTVFPDSTVC